MNGEIERIIECAEFEELLTEYLDATLERGAQRAVAAHALKCPLCHSLLNEVKDALSACHEIGAPKRSMTHLEARVLSMTMPGTAMHCGQFEDHLTDYLDGFLPATLFHRWERHAVLCEHCTDLPGAVVRSIAALYTIKAEEMPVPAALHQRILEATIGTAEARKVRAAWSSRAFEWLRGLSFPMPLPQFASVLMMLVFAAFVFSQTVSADVYQRSYELAEQTYKQGAGIVLGIDRKTEASSTAEPVRGIDAANEDGK
jgi:anti-sigma factor RsiW